MTLDQFLEKLEQTPRRWHLLSGDALRMSNEDFSGWCNACPVSSVSGLHAGLAWEVADAVGLCANDVIEVIRAADNQNGHDPELRQRLLKACGLQ